MYGVIAEEVEHIHPIAVTRNRDDKADSVDYTRFIPLLIKKVQMMDKEIQTLNKRISQLSSD